MIVSMNDSPRPTPMLTPTPLLASKPTSTSLTVTNLERVNSSTTVWRKLNAIRVESCVSLHKQVRTVSA